MGELQVGIVGCLPLYQTRGALQGVAEPEVRKKNGGFMTTLKTRLKKDARM